MVKRGSITSELTGNGVRIRCIWSNKAPLPVNSLVTASVYAYLVYMVKRDPITSELTGNAASGGLTGPKTHKSTHKLQYR